MREFFETWMQKVELEIGKIAPVSFSDLPDVDYILWWEDGDTPTEAAKKALDYAGYPFGGG